MHAQATPSPPQTGPIDASSPKNPAETPVSPPPAPPPEVAAPLGPPPPQAAPEPPQAAREPPAPTDAPVAEPAATEEAQAAEEANNWPELRFKARVMTGVELKAYHPEGLQTVPDDLEAGYFLEQAVIEAEAKLSKRLELELGFNLRTVQIRDAFANYAFNDAIEIRLGRFKRPFSRLEMRSRGRIPFRERGELNDLLVDANLASRTLGGMLHGKPSTTVRYHVAVMSPAAIGSDIEGADLIGRIQLDPTPAVSFGLGAQHKWSERSANGNDVELSAFGADAKFEAGALEITLEGALFQNPNPPPVAAQGAAAGRTPWALGAIGYATYRIGISKKWDVEPVIVLEWADPDLDYSGDDRLRAIAGLSLNFRKNALRVMPQVELQRPTSEADPRGQIASETYYLMVSSDI
jgi:hypothetical protein